MSSMYKIQIKKFVYLALIFTFFIINIGCNKETQNGNPTPTPTKFAVEIGNSKVPYIVIKTKGGQVLNEPKVPADLQIYDGTTLVTSQTIGIEFKGKTSYRISNKKSFSIECWDANGADTKTSFFGWPEGEDFNLIGNVTNTTDKFIIDRTMLYNFLAYEWSRSIGTYASRCKLVEIEIDGVYQGVYTFAEKLTRGKDRINIKSLDATSTNITGGYILSIDKSSIGANGIGKPASYFDNNWDDDAKYNAQNSFRSKYDIDRNLITFLPFGPPYHSNKYLETYFLYEHPSSDKITNDQKTYIEKYIFDMETALLKDDFSKGEKSYQNFIDVASFVDYFLLNELCRNIDAYRLSSYMSKDRDGKLVMGPIWDMNIGFDEGDRIPATDWVINYNKYVVGDAWSLPFWWNRLLEDSSFRSAVKARWQAIRSNQLSDANLQNSVDTNSKFLIDNGAITRNYKKWDQGIEVDYNASIGKLKSYLTQRAAWMDGKINAF